MSAVEMYKTMKWPAAGSGRVAKNKAPLNVVRATCTGCVSNKKQRIMQNAEMRVRAQYTEPGGRRRHPGSGPRRGMQAWFDGMGGIGR